MGSYQLENVTIEINRKCFQECVHCSSIADRTATEQLSLSRFGELIREIKSCGGTTIQISGGEPLLHKNIFEFIAESKKLDFIVELFTCGKTLNGSDGVSIDQVIENLRTNRPDKIVVSLLGASAEMHDSITRATGSYEQATDLIRGLVDDGHNVELHFVPMTPNHEDLELLLEFGAKWGVSKVNILRFVPQGRGGENKEHLLMGPEEIAMFIEKLVELEKHKDNIDIGVGSHLDFRFLKGGGEPKDCLAGIAKCLVEADGDVIPCAVFKGAKHYVAGNIKIHSFSKIWHQSELFQRFREFNPDSLKGRCKSCDFLYSCKGRCPGQRVYDYNDFYQGPDKCCPRPYYEKLTGVEG